MTSQLGKQTIATHVLPNISGSIGNRKMEKLFPDPYLKNQIQAYL